MPIIKDPIHNQHQGQFGVVYCEHLEGPGSIGGLAVYNKENDATNNVRHLPVGWKVNGTINRLAEPYIWCNVAIWYELEITDYNYRPPHGVVTDPDEQFLAGLSHWGRPLRNPQGRNRNRIYPL